MCFIATPNDVESGSESAVSYLGFLVPKDTDRSAFFLQSGEARGVGRVSAGQVLMSPGFRPELKADREEMARKRPQKAHAPRKQGEKADEMGSVSQRQMIRNSNRS